MEERDDAQQLTIWLDVGAEDVWRPNIEAFRSALERRGVGARWHVFPGQHESEYWIEHVPDYLRFYAEARGAATGWGCDDEESSCPGARRGGATHAGHHRCAGTIKCAVGHAGPGDAPRRLRHSLQLANRPPLALEPALAAVRLTVVCLGAMNHTGPGGYLDPVARAQDGRVSSM